MTPDFQKLRTMEMFGYIVTAPSSSEEIDFVSRTIIPHVQQLEDPATGSSHAALVPFWANKLNKNNFKCPYTKLHANPTPISAADENK